MLISFVTEYTMMILQNIDDSKVHLVQTEYSTYAISLFHKKK